MVILVAAILGCPIAWPAKCGGAAWPWKLSLRAGKQRWLAWQGLPLRGLSPAEEGSREACTAGACPEAASLLTLPALRASLLEKYNSSLSTASRSARRQPRGAGQARPASKQQAGAASAASATYRLLQARPGALSTCGLHTGIKSQWGHWPLLAPGQRERCLLLRLRRLAPRCCFATLLTFATPLI